MLSSFPGDDQTSADLMQAFYQLNYRIFQDHKTRFHNKAQLKGNIPNLQPVLQAPSCVYIEKVEFYAPNYMIYNTEYNTEYNNII